MARGLSPPGLLCARYCANGRPSRGRILLDLSGPLVRSVGVAPAAGPDLAVPVAHPRAKLAEGPIESRVRGRAPKHVRRAQFSAMSPKAAAPILSGRAPLREGGAPFARIIRPQSSLRVFSEPHRRRTSYLAARKIRGRLSTYRGLQIIVTTSPVAPSITASALSRDTTAWARPARQNGCRKPRAFSGSS